MAGKQWKTSTQTRGRRDDDDSTSKFPAVRASKRMLLADVTEANEPCFYLFSVDTAPARMRAYLALNEQEGKCTYESVYFDDGYGGTDKLLWPKQRGQGEEGDEGEEEEEDVSVNDDEEEAECKEVYEWLCNMANTANKFKVPFVGTIDYHTSPSSVRNRGMKRP